MPIVSVASNVMTDGLGFLQAVVQAKLLDSLVQLSHCHEVTVGQSFICDYHFG